MNTEESIRPIGTIELVIEYDNGKEEKRIIDNTVLRTGRNALASSLANEFGDTYDFFVSRMLFGDDGTNAGVPKFVNSDRNGLFGITRANKSVISIIDVNLPSQVIFTSVLTFEEANGVALNEMALQMNDGDLYSMVTFADLTKTSSMQITFNWRINFV